VYDEDHSSADREVWSCRTVAELYDWMRQAELSVAEFDEV